MAGTEGSNAFQWRRADLGGGVEGYFHCLGERCCASLFLGSSPPYELTRTKQGVRIYDTASSQRITYISRPEDSPRADLFKCTLHWKDDRTLLIAWADMIKVATVRERESKRSLAAVPGVGGVIGASSELYVEVTAIFQVDCMVSGIAPYGSNGDLLVLAYLTEEDFDDEIPSDQDQQRRKEAIMPELRIISSEGEELSSDAISLRNYARFQCRDYSLVPTADGKAFYVVAPLDVVVVKTRDEEDHVVWLIEQKRYEEALTALEKSGMAAAGGFDISDVGKKYLEFLVDDGASFPPPLPLSHTLNPSLSLQVNLRKPPKLVRSFSASTRSCGKTGYSSLPTRDS
jgi:hypothetical protein